MSWITVEGNQFIKENGERIIFKAHDPSDPDKLEITGIGIKSISAKSKAGMPIW